MFLKKDPIVYLNLLAPYPVNRNRSHVPLIQFSDPFSPVPAQLACSRLLSPAIWPAQPTPYVHTPAPDVKLLQTFPPP
jgi:hypothetical protein